MDMRMVHSLVVNENEASPGVMIVVHLQSQVPKPDTDEFVLKTGFMCLKSGMSISCFPYGMDRIEPHAWLDWPKYHNMMERPTITVDNVTYVAIRAKGHDDARGLYGAVLKRSAIPAAVRVRAGVRSELSTPQRVAAKPAKLVQHLMGEDAMEEVSDCVASVETFDTSPAFMSVEMRNAVNQMVSESVQGHVAELNRTLGEKIESLGQVLMSHFSGAIRNALPAPVDAVQPGQLQRQLALRQDTHRNV
jgi:hypothetical protein